MPILDSCSWDRPGADRFIGDPVVAIARYDLPPPVLKELQAKMRKHAYDDIAVIDRDKIVGTWHDYGELRMMHFGSRGTICKTVTRSKWSFSTQERALIYYVDGYTVAVPTVCGNVSLITRYERQNHGDGKGSGFLIPDTNPSAGSYGDQVSGGGGKTPETPLLRGTGGGSPDRGISGTGPYPVPPAGPTFLNPYPVPVPHHVPVWSQPPNQPSQPSTLPPATAIPEPSTWLMMVAGLSALILRKRHD
jgi:hypothetical protein